MKKIKLIKVKKELEKMNCDETSKELIINNIQMYNELIENKNENGKVVYLLYQLNQLIFKQLAEIKKSNKISTTDAADDDFTSMLNSVKSKIEKR